MLFKEVVSNAPQFFYLVPLGVGFPVAGLLINAIFGGRFSEKVIGTVASTASGLAFVVAVLQAISLAGNPEGAVIPLVDWIHAGDLTLHWGFQVDTLAVTMMLVVSGVGTLIHIYAIGYMHEDVRHNGDPGRFRRFFVFFNLFIAAMMILVSADNYIMLFVGWEGVGLCSYLLIGFWYEKGKDGIGNAIAAKKAFVVNRIGDFGFLMAAFTMFTYFRTFDFNAVFAAAPGVASIFPGAILAITLFMLLGVTGKSAQLPLFVWLPDAMAGPTPVSALIHAATMVTAGVYLVARSHVLYSLVPQAQNIVALVGGLTALFAATIAVGQFDIKKVLAYSTISQLGYMVAAVGMGAYVAGMFHLITHAFFKALLFLSAGSVIQGVEKGEHHVAHDPKLKRNAKTIGHEFDPQDMRNMGGLRHRMKITYWVYLIGAIALAGVPPLAGFWSKDEILAEGKTLNAPVYWLLAIAAFLTAFYMGRQILMVFFGEPRSASAEHAEENPPIMTIPLMVLGALSLIGGLLNFPGIDSLTLWLEHTIQSVQEVPFNLVVASLSIVLALLAIGISYYFYAVRYKAMQAIPKAKRPDDPLRSVLGPIFYGMERKWFVDEFYETIIVRPYKWMAHMLSRGEAEAADPTMVQDFLHEVIVAGSYRVFSNLMALTIDLGFIDAIATGMARLVERSAKRLRNVQTGFVRNYALVVFLGVVLIIGYLILR
jgi:NADH-quinone oxidoreductase subunit L